MRTRSQTLGLARHLRRNLSLPEGLLWDQLKGRRTAGLKFRRQHPIGSYVLDFFCAERQLAVELDGGTHSHPAQIEHDRKRDAWLAERGIKVFRLPAIYVLEDAVGAAALIGAAADPPKSEPRTTHRIR